MKKMKSFRLSSLSFSRLESMAKETDMSQSQLLEELISACFDEAFDGYRGEKARGKGFERVRENMRWRIENHIIATD
jgi:predicted DNA-binding protein